MARSADQSRPLYDDSDPDTEPETFKPQRNGTRKRLSEAYNPDNDASFASDSGVRAQKSSVDINDDAAEKRRRRKSTKIAVHENAHAGPSSEGNDEVDKSRTIKQKQQLTTVAPLPPPEKESIDILSSKFEEWMKLTTDNVSSHRALCNLTRLIFASRKSRLPILGNLPSSTTFTRCLYYETRTTIPSISSVPLVPSMVVSKSGLAVSTALGLRPLNLHRI